MSDNGNLFIVRFWIIAICVAWISVVGWREIVVRGNMLESREAALRTGAASCAGSFSSRYECRSARLIGAENAIFVNWGMRLAKVFLPPLALLYLFGKYARRRESQAAERARRAVLKRKSAQQLVPAGHKDEPL